VFVGEDVTRLDNQRNNKGTVKYNAMFDTIIQRNSYRGHRLLLNVNGIP